MARDLVTRRVLARQLALNAATRPLNLAVPSAVAVAGLLLHALWLVPVAALVYVAMLVATFFDGGEAERVGRETYARSRPAARPQLDPWQFAAPTARKLALAHAEEARIRVATGDPGLTDEVARLMAELDRLALRAQRVHDYLRDLDEVEIRNRLLRLRGTAGADDSAESAAAALEDQLAVGDDLRRRLSQFDTEMEHIVASLGAIHGQIVRMNVAEDAAARDDVASLVRDLRTDVTAAADAMHEAHRELDTSTDRGSQISKPRSSQR